MLSIWATSISAMQPGAAVLPGQITDGKGAAVVVVAEGKTPCDLKLAELIAVYEDDMILTEAEVATIGTVVNGKTITEADVKENKIREFHKEKFRGFCSAKDPIFQRLCREGNISDIREKLDGYKVVDNPFEKTVDPVALLNTETLQNYFKYSYYCYNVKHAFQATMNLKVIQELLRHENSTHALTDEDIRRKITDCASNAGHSGMIEPLTAELRKKTGIASGKKLKHKDELFMKRVIDTLATHSAEAAIAKGHRTANSVFTTSMLKAYTSTSQTAPQTESMTGDGTSLTSGDSCCCDNCCCLTCCTLCDCCDCWQGLWKSFKKSCTCS